MVGETPAVEAERKLRFAFFERLEPEDWVARDVAPATLNARVDGFCAYRGQSGIWYDAGRTRNLAGPGVTVSVLHTGRYYPDDLSDDCVVYHYPVTTRQGKDAVEVAATKNAAELNLPVLVITEVGPNRDIYLSWVADWDDETREFLILFASSATPPAVAESIESEWVKFSDKPKHRVEVLRRDRDPQFAFRVRQRYGAACAVCRLAVVGLIDAAHIIPVADGGSNDPRNGIPLCPTHHRAFDQNAFLVNPHTLELVTPGVDSLDDLRIPVTSIDHLPAKPHVEALAWRWESVMR